jgi:predicted RNase H-like HicB family nuclease
MKYVIVKEKADDGTWWVRVPELPGCFSWGETPEAAALNAREAIEGHIGVMRQFGDPVPDGFVDDQLVEIVDVADAR